MTFAKDVEVNGKLYVSGDQAGTVKIPAGMTSSTISFTGPYEATPKVVVTPKDIYSLFYAVKNVSTSSFDLIISQSQEKEIDFDWIALATKSQTASTDQVQNNIPEVVIVDPQIPNQSEASSTPTSTPDSEIISSSTDPIIDSSSSTPPEVSSTDSVL